MAKHSLRAGSGAAAPGAGRSPGAPNRGVFTLAAVLAAVTAAACLAACLAEAWRFALMLKGRTQVLPGDVVRLSDAWVQAAGIAALWFGLLTAGVVLWTVVGVYRAAAQEAGCAPARSGPALVGRGVVPGWNLYGAGQLLMETTKVVTRVRRDRARFDNRRSAAPVRLAIAWWIAWVANGVMAVVAVVLAGAARRWHSRQLVADAVQAHIAVDLIAALVAVMTLAVMVSLRRMWAPRVSRLPTRWLVRQPTSTAANLPHERAPTRDVSGGERSADSPTVAATGGPGSVT